MNRYFIKISYNGTAYHGWQVQNNGITVQEVLNKSISTVIQNTINIVGCGRTDSGVHATEFYAHFDLKTQITENFIYRLNRLLPDDISVHSIKRVDENAHTRFDAISRKYKYRLHTFKDPFSKNRSYFFNIPLDLNKMNEACKIIKNYEDFTSFSKLHTQVKTNNCKIFMAEWLVSNNHIIFEIEANRFLRNMVRAIVGTMINVGKNKISLTEFEEIIKSKNRSQAGMSVPACGLYLIGVKYPFDVDA